MLTVRIQVIDGTGTFTQSDSQPCRLLTSLHEHYTRFIATTGQSAPLRRIGTFGLAVGAACALYGLFIVKRFQNGDLFFLLSSSVSLFDLEIPFLRPDPQYLQSRRAQELSRLAVALTFPRALNLPGHTLTALSTAAHSMRSG
jgi:hypothetical protein